MRSNHEKREYHRRNVSFPVRIELSDQRRVEGIAINIGQGGMLLNIISDATFTKLDDVNLYLPLNHNQTNFAIAAKITRVDGTQIGLFFYSDPSKYLQETLD